MIDRKSEDVRDSNNLHIVIRKVHLTEVRDLLIFVRSSFKLCHSGHFDFSVTSDDRDR